MARSPEERSATGTGSGVLAVRLHDDGLKVEEIETPSPDPGEVLVRVHAAAITRDELAWPVDRLPAIPSYELSGVVVGSGDEVYALTPFDRDGVAAEYAVVPADVLAPKPSRLSHVEAAALPMGGLTAWQALFARGRLARGERVLITGASGGVGHIAVQLARLAGGCGLHVVKCPQNLSPGSGDSLTRRTGLPNRLDSSQFCRCRRRPPFLTPSFATEVLGCTSPGNKNPRFAGILEPSPGLEPG